jgi:hypothetical protein
MEHDDVTQEELDACVRELRANGCARWQRLPTDYAGVWWCAAAWVGADKDAATTYEGLGIDARGRVHWFWRHADVYHADGVLPLTPAARTLCRLPDTWGKFVARLRAWLAACWAEESRDV